MYSLLDELLEDVVVVTKEQQPGKVVCDQGQGARCPELVLSSVRQDLLKETNSVVAQEPLPHWRQPQLSALQGRLHPSFKPEEAHGGPQGGEAGRGNLLEDF